MNFNIKGNMTYCQSIISDMKLSQIANMLLLNGTLTEYAGLVHGKMGIAVFFFHYARHTENMLFADYAIDLIGEMQNQLHVNSRADYENGIAGIGMGIDYLIRDKFLLVEEDICEDFDERMYRAVMYEPWQDFSMYDGLTGYGRYWMTRMRYQASAGYAGECLMYITERIEESLSDIPLKEQIEVYCFLYDLHKITGFDRCAGLLEQCRKWDLFSIDINRGFHRLENSRIREIISTHQYNHYFKGAVEEGIVLKQVPELDMEKPPVSMGLLTGYAGEGLRLLTAMGSADLSWMLLL